MPYLKSIAPAALALFFLSGCGTTGVPTVSTATPAPAVSSSSVVTSSVAVNPSKTYTFPGVLPAEEIQNKQIRITTAKGDIVFGLYPDTAPMAVSNFIYLTNEGYYDGLVFHRVEKVPAPFIIQGGDPLGTGRGGPGYRFNDELTDSYTYDRGVVAMANAGTNTNGSQFFIMLADFPLPKNYTIFGQVTDGLEVVDQIKIGDEMISVAVEDK